MRQNRESGTDVSEKQQYVLGILEVRNSLGHPSDSSNDVAMGDHDTFGDACGAAGVHDDGDV